MRWSRAMFPPRLIFLASALLLCARCVVGQTVVNSTFVGPSSKYSDPHNWSPSEVPNNTTVRQYNVNIGAGVVAADIDPTISNLTLGAAASLYVLGHNLAINASLSNQGLISVSQAQGSAGTVTAGALANFDSATRTITGGNFAIGGFDTTVAPAELRFNGADIVVNGSVIQLIGPAARITDLAGNDGLRNLTRTLLNGAILLSQRELTIPGQFRNDGNLTLTANSIFAVAGGLQNFDPATQTLSAGVFDLNLNSQLRFAGADIVHNAARLSIAEGATVRDLAGSDALRNFNDNLSNGDFTVGAAVGFAAAGDFKNAGKITVAPNSSRTSLTGKFIVPQGFRYTQTSGSTINFGLLAADQIEILNGTLEGNGIFAGNVTLTNGTIIPSPPTRIQGNLTLGGGSHFHFQRFAEPYYEISGKVTLGGTLEVDLLPSAGSISSTAVFTVLKSAQPLSGVFGNAPNGSRIPTTDGTGSVVVTYGTNAVFVSQYHANSEAPPVQFLNISSRAFLSRADDDPFADRAVIIGGFIISGSPGPKDVVVRGLGASLSKFGLSPVLADPVLELHAADGLLIAANDNWEDTQRPEIAASGLAPTDAREAALRAGLQPGAYTVVIREKGGLAGTGLVEIYDLSQGTSSNLANISTRGFTDSTNLLIGGIIAGGARTASTDIVVRALGPQLKNYAILNALDDPSLELRDSNGALIAFNDDWISNSDQINASRLAPSNNTESALLVSLPPANYTAIVRPKGNSGGVATVEFYDLRASN